MEPVYSARLDAAIAHAVDSFRGVRRKGSGVPYLTHLLAVCALVGEHGGDEDQMMAAVLHDWLEDIDGATPDELERRYGPRVARLVGALSDSVGSPKPPWRARKEAYLAHLVAEPDDVRLVSAADKLHNATTILRDVRAHGLGVFDRFRGGREGTLWYYDALVTALGTGWQHPILGELADAVARLNAEVARRDAAAADRGGPNG